MNAPSQRIIPVHRGHIFRSELVEAIARLEQWTLHVLQKAADPSATGKKAKIPQFVTQRVKRVRDLEDTHPELVRSWADTISLLDELEQYWKLRTDLVHAVLTATIGDDGIAYFTFESTGAEEATSWDRRKTFKEAELTPISRRSERLIGRLVKQLPD